MKKKHEDIEEFRQPFKKILYKAIRQEEKKGSKYIRYITEHSIYRTKITLYFEKGGEQFQTSTFFYNITI